MPSNWVSRSYSRLEAAHLVLEVCRRYLFFDAVPHLVDERSISVDEFAIGSERVVEVSVASELLLEEVLSQFFAVAETLERRVHVAGVSDVFQTDRSSATKLSERFLFVFRFDGFLWFFVVRGARRRISRGGVLGLVVVVVIVVVGPCVAVTVV